MAVRMKHARSGVLSTKRGVWIGIGAAALICVIVLVLLMARCSGKSIDAISARKEPNAERYEEVSSEKVEHPQDGGGVQITYSTEVTVDFEKGTASLLFQNPAVSDQIMTVQIVLANTPVAQSGRIEPGYMVTELELLIEELPQNLPPATYAGEFYVQYYDEETKELALFDTRIPITIEIVEE